MCSSVQTMIVWCLMPFSTVFQLYHSGQCTYPCFPGILLTRTPHNIPREEWILSQWPSSIPRKNIGRAGDQNQWPPVLKSCMLPTELLGLGLDRVILWHPENLENSIKFWPLSACVDCTNWYQWIILSAYVLGPVFREQPSLHFPTLYLICQFWALPILQQIKIWMSKIWTNEDTIFWLSRKHWGKRRNCPLRAISSFPTMFFESCLLLMP